MRQRDALGHGGHGNEQAQRHADGCTDEQRDGDVDVSGAGDSRHDQRADHRQEESHLARENALARGLRVGHPLERQHKADGTGQVQQPDDHRACAARVEEVMHGIGHEPTSASATFLGFC